MQEQHIQPWWTSAAQGLDGKGVLGWSTHGWTVELDMARATARLGKARHQTEWQMKINDKTIVITGTNRGIGQALVEEALRRGAKRVYAGTRALGTRR